MSYQRLTPKDLEEAINMPPYEDMTRFLVYAHRLWELENAIEEREKQGHGDAPKNGREKIF